MKKNVFLMAGILLLSLLLLPGLSGCGAISSLMATPTPTITSTPTPTPIVLTCRVITVTGARQEEYPFNVYALNVRYLGEPLANIRYAYTQVALNYFGQQSDAPIIQALQVDIVGEQGPALRSVLLWKNQETTAGRAEMTLVVQEERTYSLSGNTYTIDAEVGYVDIFTEFEIVEYRVIVSSNSSFQECSR